LHFSENYLFDRLDPANFPGSQPDFDTMGMKRTVGQDILDNSLGNFAGTLVIFQYDSNFSSNLHFTSLLF
jgi:hypothetical protein